MGGVIERCRKKRGTGRGGVGEEEGGTGKGNWEG